MDQNFYQEVMYYDIMLDMLWFNFILGLKFFPFVFGYGNEFKTKGNKN